MQKSSNTFEYRPLQKAVNTGEPQVGPRKNLGPTNNSKITGVFSGIEAYFNN